MPPAITPDVAKAPGMPQQTTKPSNRFLQIWPQFLVDDVAKTAGYYRDALGFRIDFLYGQPPAYGAVSRDAVTLHLKKASPAGCFHSARSGEGVDALILLTGVDELCEEFKSRGAKILRGPASQPYGMREFALEDCNGYVLVFTEEC